MPPDFPGPLNIDGLYSRTRQLIKRENAFSTTKKRARVLELSVDVVVVQTGSSSSVGSAPVCEKKEESAPAKCQKRKSPQNKNEYIINLIHTRSE